MVKDGKRCSVCYTLLAASAIHLFAILVLRTWFQSAMSGRAHNPAQWLVLSSIVPLVVLAVMSNWYPRASSALAGAVYAFFVGFVVSRSENLLEGGAFLFREVPFAVLFVVPTVVLLIIALVAAFRKGGIRLSWKRQLLIFGAVALVLAGVLFQPTRTFVTLVRAMPADMESAERLSQRFSTRTLRSMAGSDPEHYLGVPLNGAAELALGLQNTPESIAALEEMLDEIEAQIDPDATDEDETPDDRLFIIDGLAHAPDYDYGTLFERYSDDPDMLHVVAMTYMWTQRRDCDELFVDYFREFRRERPDGYHTQRMADYLRDRGIEIEDAPQTENEEAKDD